MPKIKILKDELKAEIVELDKRYNVYQSIKHNYPFNDFLSQERHFYLYAEFLESKYKLKLYKLRLYLTSLQFRKFISDFSVGV